MMWPDRSGGTPPRPPLPRRLRAARAGLVGVTAVLFTFAYGATHLQGAELREGTVFLIPTALAGLILGYWVPPSLGRPGRIGLIAALIESLLVTLAVAALAGTLLFPGLGTIAGLAIAGTALIDLRLLALWLALILASHATMAALRRRAAP